MNNLAYCGFCPNSHHGEPCQSRKAIESLYYFCAFCSMTHNGSTKCKGYLTPIPKYRYCSICLKDHWHSHETKPDRQCKVDKMMSEVEDDDLKDLDYKPNKKR